MESKKNNNKYSRKEFLKKASAGTAGLALGTMGMSAKGYANILGANDRVNHAVVGLHGRGQAHMKAVSQLPSMRLRYVCDVDSKILKKRLSLAKKLTDASVKGEGDVRKLLEKKDIDSISIATPDHWHTPMALMALHNGKHVYVEKPCCHNPAEGEMLVAAKKKYNNLKIQMGTQNRSAPLSIKAAQDIKDGIIGDVYMGKAWYDNKRGPIGNAVIGKVPKQLNWDLWQGPAPHVRYKPIWTPYNWHWFWHWGTGEINNNGIHQMDQCRWFLGIDEEYPIKANSAGGRYAYNDSWQYYDTQVASFEYGMNDSKLVTWEGRSCNAFDYYGEGRGVTIYGKKGTIMTKGGSRFYGVYDLEGKPIQKPLTHKSRKHNSTNIIGGDFRTVLHFKNFANAILKGEKLHSPMDISHKSNLLAHLGNYAQKSGNSLEINPANGHIVNNPEAEAMWTRDYQPGWEPKV